MLKVNLFSIQVAAKFYMRCWYKPYHFKIKTRNQCGHRIFHLILYLDEQLCLYSVAQRFS